MVSWIVAVLLFQRVPVPVCENGRNKSHQAKVDSEEEDTRSLHVDECWKCEGDGRVEDGSFLRPVRTLNALLISLVF